MTTTAPETVRSLLDYDPDSGVLTWRDTDRHGFNRCLVGTPALTARSTRGYLQGRLQGKNVRAHRVAWCHYYGAWPTGQIDHINRDKTDNRISNLRDVSASENMRNTHRAPDAGLIPRPNGRWQVQLRRGGEQHYGGTFSNKQEAAEARDRLRDQLDQSN